LPGFPLPLSFSFAQELQARREVGCKDKGNRRASGSQIGKNKKEGIQKSNIAGVITKVRQVMHKGVAVWGGVIRGF